MLTIAHTAPNPLALQQFARAFPDAELMYVSFDKLQRLLTSRPVTAVVLTAEALANSSAHRIAVVKARHPSLIVLGYLPATPGLWQQTRWLRSVHADVLMVDGVEDHPQRLQQAFAAAALASVAYSFERASSPSPPLLAAANLEVALRDIATVKSAARLAALLGASLKEFRAELMSTQLLSPKACLAWLRLATAARLLGDSSDTVERVSHLVGYGSSTALRNACHHLASATPHDMRGGLKVVIDRYKRALVTWRTRYAA